MEGKKKTDTVDNSPMLSFVVVWMRMSPEGLDG